MKNFGVIIFCLTLMGCIGEGGTNVTVNADRLGSVTKQVASNVTLEEINVVDDMEDEELLQAPFYDESSTVTIAARTAVGSYDVGGYACNIIHDPNAEYIWSIHRYNLNDSLNTSQQILGVTDNRKIQSVACTPDGAYALFSVKQTKSSDYEVYSFDLITDKIVQLTDNDTDDVDVTMSSDGLKIAWQERLSDNRQAISIRTYNITRTNFTQKGLASANPFVQPSLSPNGKWLALVQLRPSNFLALRYNVENNQFSTIKSIVRRKRLFHPSVSDDGNIYGWIENFKQTRYVVRNIDQNQSTLVFTNPQGEGIRHPKISFDGQWVTYSQNDEDSRRTYLRHIEDGDVATIGEELLQPARYLGASWMGTYVYPQDLQLHFSTETVEEGDTVQLSISRSGTGVEPLVVFLNSSDETVLQVPLSISFAKGELAKSLSIQPVDDEVVNGTQSVTITASALGSDSVTKSIEVLDATRVQEFTLTLQNIDGVQILPIEKESPGVELNSSAWETDIGSKFAVTSTLVSSVIDEEYFSVDVFTETNGIWEKTLEIPQRMSEAGEFGRSISISGNSLIIGSPDRQYDEFGPTKIVELNETGDTINKVTSIEPMGRHFGWSVSIDGDWAAISSPLLTLSQGTNEENGVYMYQKHGDGWLLKDMLPSFLNSNFGYKVHLKGDLLVVSTPSYTDSINQAFFMGTATVFERAGTSWYPVADFVGSLPRETYQNAGRSKVFVSESFVGVSSNNGNMFFAEISAGDTSPSLIELQGLEKISSEGFGKHFAFNDNYLLVANSEGVALFKKSDTIWAIEHFIDTEGREVRGIDMTGNKVALFVAGEVDSIVFFDVSLL